MQTLHARLPDTKILLLSVLPSIRSSWVDANTVELNHALAARYGGTGDVRFQDLTPLFHHLPGGGFDPDDFLDGHLSPPDPPLHPSPRMQERIAEAIEPNVSRMMR